MARTPKVAEPAATYTPEAFYEVRVSRNIQHPDFPKLRFFPDRSYTVKGLILEAIKEAVSDAKELDGATGG